MRERRLVGPVFKNLSLTNRSKSRPATREKGISLHAVLDCTFNATISPDMPKIMNRLKLLLPMMLPKTISFKPSYAANVFTTSSGAEVPNATTVNPIASSETLKRFASAEAPATNQSAPFISSINPATINSNCMSMVFLCCYLTLSKASSGSIGLPWYFKNNCTSANTSFSQYFTMRSRLSSCQ